MAARQKREAAEKPQRRRGTPARPPQDRHRYAAARCRHCVQPLLDRAARGAPRHLGQFQHLRNLWVENGLTQAELSRRIGIEMASSTAILDSLEAAKFITRVRNTTDRRRSTCFHPGRRRAGEGADGLRCGRQQARQQGPQPGRGRSAVRAGRADHRQFQDAAGRRSIVRQGGRRQGAESTTRERAARTGASEHAAGGGVTATRGYFLTAASATDLSCARPFSISRPIILSMFMNRQSALATKLL